ncbi:MAG TPA: preprotein translocase subunit SecG [Desulfosalsimonadaceae bacterium]|nr:preprotein translocase subunit SecG [Desulfosalsimonadaceae bacterium]
MPVLIIILHLIVCFALIGIVLLQTGKGADMGAVFGGAGNQTLFGNTGGGSFLGKATTAAAIIFMLTSLSLAYISKSGNESVVTNVQPAAEQTQTLPAGAEKGAESKGKKAGETAPQAASRAGEKSSQQSEKAPEKPAGN